MNRFGIIFSALITLMLPCSSAYAAMSIVNSKHDLSLTSTGATIKSTSLGTTEVCVFCHTPHSAADIANTPLWNKDIFTNPDPSYTVYTSDILAALSYQSAEQPLRTGKAIHIRNTRLCLSCHDGTIALGTLKNLPYGLYGDVPMTGGVTTMPTTAAGYIGVELQDDHPVAIPYSPGSGSGLDAELLVSPSSPVRLFYDSSSGNNYVECTSCHDAHDNQYGNFLVASNAGSAICMSCHNKTGFTGGIHDIATQPYSPPDGTGSGYLGATVGNVKCMNCHFPHKAGVNDTAKTTPVPNQGRYLLSFKEEESCFNTNLDRWDTVNSNTACHGGSGVKNIYTEVTKTSAHRVGNYTGIHTATEARQTVSGGWVNEGGSGAKWHVECADCHNPHTAGSGLHSRGLSTGNQVSSGSILYGTGGVGVVAYPSWPSPPSTGTYSSIQAAGVTNNAVTGVGYEYEICFKCHTDFAWGTNPPNSPSLGMQMTNQAVEFYPANPGRHPVVAATGRDQGTLLAPWNSNIGTQTMYCSDCHTKEGDASPRGPHGSNNPFILRMAFADTTAAKGINQPATDLCFECHDSNTYLNGSGTTTGFKTTAGTNLHTQHYINSTNAISNYGYRCVNCHTRIPHGWLRKAMIIVQGEGATYGAQYEAGGANAGLIQSIVGGALPQSGNYGVGKNTNCTTAVGCH